MIVINYPKIIDLLSYKFYVGPRKDEFGIVNYNSRRTYCPHVPKQYTFNATKGSPQVLLISCGQIQRKKQTINIAMNAKQNTFINAGKQK